MSVQRAPGRSSIPGGTHSMRPFSSSRPRSGWLAGGVQPWRLMHLLGLLRSSSQPTKHWQNGLSPSTHQELEGSQPPMLAQGTGSHLGGDPTQSIPAWHDRVRLPINRWCSGQQYLAVSDVHSIISPSTSSRCTSLVHSTKVAGISAPTSSGRAPTGEGQLPVHAASGCPGSGWQLKPQHTAGIPAGLLPVGVLHTKESFGFEAHAQS
mmetsp:Transcript_68125/g.181277  ORF Transcript_68125/g.181277 Transcript_68125/m.181277 type:complete len:208 (-) Transcript_68125:26-649(-)